MNITGSISDLKGTQFSVMGHRGIRYLSLKDVFIERFISLYKPLPIEKGRIRIAGEKGSIVILYNPQVLECKLSHTVFSNHEAQPETAYIIDFEVKVDRTDFNTEFIFEIITESE